MSEPSDAEQCLRESKALWSITEASHGDGQDIRWSCNIRWNITDPAGGAHAQTAYGRWLTTRSAAIACAVTEATSKGWIP